MTLWEHLAELRSRIVKCVIAVAIGAVVGWLIFRTAARLPAASRYCDLMNGQNCDLHRHRPARRASPSASRCRSTSASPSPCRCCCGSSGASSRPGSTRTRSATPCRSSFSALAAVPLRRGHRLPHAEPGAAVPRSASAAASITPLYTAQSYVKLIVFMMLAFGVGFEFPVLLVALADRRRRHARGSSATGGARPS